ncbi:hypothetical protein BDR26DRAFT_922674 [Obelidium mucronatum]|nr:hypothetical protein BDR26DRAFT_922674 [Obelidium mucronatum]
MIRNLMITSLLAASLATAAPNDTVCSGDNWDRGENAVDPNAPPGPYPVAGQQVYIKDVSNFCINLPNPDDPTLKQLYYSKGLKPTVVQAEGYVRSYCVGQQLPGSLPMPAGAITTAHITRNFTVPGNHYMQITGYMNCDVLGINCQGENSGQYDSVPYRNCGKEPYSNVNTELNPGFENYVEQAGDGIFCMRTCQGGLQLNDPCNVKNDTAGCAATMGFNTNTGFTFLDVSGGGVTSLAGPVITTTTTTAAATTAAQTQVATVVSTTSKSGAMGRVGYVENLFFLSGTVVVTSDAVIPQATTIIQSPVQESLLVSSSSILISSTTGTTSEAGSVFCVVNHYSHGCRDFIYKVWCNGDLCEFQK